MIRDSVPRLSFLYTCIAATALALLGAPAHADTIAFTGFEGTSADTWLGVSISGAGSISTDGTGQFPAGQRILAGLRSFQGNNGIATVDFDTIDVSAFDSIQLTIRISSTSATTGNGNDTQDFVQLFVALNGAAFLTDAEDADITLFGSGNSRWGFDGNLTGSTTAGSPMVISGSAANPYSTLTITIPNSATSVDFRIVTRNDNSGEFWNIDNVSLTGVTTAPEPSVGAAFLGGLGMLGGFPRLRRRRG